VLVLTSTTPAVRRVLCPPTSRTQTETEIKLSALSQRANNTIAPQGAGLFEKPHLEHQLQGEL
jgi:hypothetical protein